MVSAGSHPKPMHPNAVRVMRSYGIDLTGARSKHLDDVIGRRFDYVITLCDKVREVCPEFPGHPEPIHWSIPDPPPRRRSSGYPAFRAVAADLDTRIDFLIQAIAPRPAAGREDRHDRNRRQHGQRPLHGRRRAGALDFYTTHLGFTVRTAHLPAFADVTRGNLRAAALRAGQFRGTCRCRTAGSRSRVVGTVSTSSWPTCPPRSTRLRAAGVTFRNDIVTGPRRSAGPPRRPLRQPDRTVRPRSIAVTEADPAEDPLDRARPSMATVLREWGRIGCIGFGGPPTHIRLLRELCVERQRWIGAVEFEDAVAACNLLPGPGLHPAGDLLRLAGPRPASARWSAGPRSSCPG